MSIPPYTHESFITESQAIFALVDPELFAPTFEGFGKFVVARAEAEDAWRQPKEGRAKVANDVAILKGTIEYDDYSYPASVLILLPGKIRRRLAEAQGKEPMAELRLSIEVPQERLDQDLDLEY